MSLHCAELLVNVVRDELTWRKASKRGIKRKPTNVVIAVITSPPALVLLTLKPVIHWLYSLAVTTYFDVGLVMHPPQIFYLSGGAIVLACFATMCAFWQPKGPQPAAFGHLQTLVDLIDEWPETDERLYWGRKEVIEGNGTIANEEAVELLPVSHD
jgi:hypothetical protein